MKFKENIVILFALTSLADNLNIKNDELAPTEKLSDKFNNLLDNEKITNIIGGNDKMKEIIINLFKKYVSKLSDNKSKKGK